MIRPFSCFTFSISSNFESTAASAHANNGHLLPQVCPVLERPGMNIDDIPTSNNIIIIAGVCCESVPFTDEFVTIDLSRLPRGAARRYLETNGLLNEQNGAEAFAS